MEEAANKKNTTPKKKGWSWPFKKSDTADDRKRSAGAAGVVAFTQSP
jgi:hypothetical protein